MIRSGKILLAEDNPRDVELTLEALREHGLADEVVVVRDGVDALDYLLCRGEYAEREPGDPAVVLLDLKMPRMDGLEVLRKMRETPALRMLPVVILTSSRDENDLLRGYELGTNAYVVKPVSFSDLMRTVAQLGLFWTEINEPPPQVGSRGKDNRAQ